MSERSVRRRGALTRDDLKVWAHVLRGVDPMRGRPRFEAEIAAAVAEPAPPRAPLPAPAAPVRPAPPPLGVIEPRLRRRLSRGQRAVDGVIDLHGLRQQEAHAALIGFVHRAQHQGRSIVLVITGKGGAGPDDARGVLRRVVPHWLADPALRPFVIGFEPAARSHGGDGSLYVRIRRPRA